MVIYEAPTLNLGTEVDLADLMILHCLLQSGVLIQVTKIYNIDNKVLKQGLVIKRNHKLESSHRELAPTV